MGTLSILDLRLKIIKVKKRFSNKGPPNTPRIKKGKEATPNSQ